MYLYNATIWYPTFSLYPIYRTTVLTLMSVRMFLYVTHLRSASTQKGVLYALLTATPRKTTYSPVEIVQVILNTEHFCLLFNNSCYLAADDIITRTPDSSETLTITFNLNFEELEQNLYARGLDLPSLYSALNDSLHTPLQDIQFSRYVTTDGKLELVLLSDSFQVDPGILTGTLRTSLLCKWAPYVPYVTQVSANGKLHVVNSTGNNISCIFHLLH